MGEGEEGEGEEEGGEDGEGEEEIRFQFDLWETVIIILSHFFSKLQILLLPLPAFL